MTAPALAVNVAVVKPDGTNTEEGTVNEETELLTRDTVVSPTGAALERVTVHVVEAEAASVVFPHCSDVMEIGAVEALIKKATETLEVPIDAVTLALRSELTTAAVAVNVAMVAPAGTSTEAGTVNTEGGLLASDTVVPPAGAAFEVMTLQVVDAEEVRLVLPHCSDVMVILAVICRVAVLLEPFRVAVMVGVWSEVTAAAVAVNVIVIAPAGTSTETGTVNAEVRLLERDTVVPPVGAALEMMTLQLVEPEAARLVLPHCSDVMDRGALMMKAAEALEAPREAVTLTF